jgi:uncharacterized protein (TIGR00106 family)
MLVAFSVSPVGSAGDDGSVHEAVAAAVRVVRDSGLPNQTDAMFTTIEGDWDEVFAVVKAATEAVGAFGPRVSLVLKADIRPGHTGELTGKVERVERALATDVSIGDASAATSGAASNGAAANDDSSSNSAAE